MDSFKLYARSIPPFLHCLPLRWSPSLSPRRDPQVLSGPAVSSTGLCVGTLGSSPGGAVLRAANAESWGHLAEEVSRVS